MSQHKGMAQKNLLAQQKERIAKLEADVARLQASLGDVMLENKRLAGNIHPENGSHTQTIEQRAPRVLKHTDPSTGKVSEIAVAKLFPPKQGQASSLPIPAATQAGKFPSTVAELNRCKAPAIITNSSNLFFRGFNITDEQQIGLNLAMSGEDLKINAGAGAGKTTQLAAISHEFGTKQYGRHKSLYLAFNKSIVNDAKTAFHTSTKCITGHGLAFASVGSHFANRGRLEGRLTGAVVVQALGLTDFMHISAYTLASLLIAWVAKFCQSSDESIGIKNVPWDFMKVLTLEGDKRKAYEVGTSYAREFQPLAVRLWEQLIDYKGLLPITHDVYLKLWALDAPRLPYQTIFFDESQDASPVMMSVIESQKAQKIWVGDRRQQIYSWRGAVNAMDAISAKNTTTLTRSFRYGQPVAELANSVLRNFLNEHEFSVVGSPRVNSIIQQMDNPTAYLCRTNRSAVSELMRALDRRKRVHITGGVEDLIMEIESADALMTGRRPRSAAFQVFKDWNELVEYSESPAGNDMKPLIKMIDQWGVHDLRNALGRVSGIKEESADLVIATVHKSKGREFQTVKLADDFVFPSTDKHECKAPFSDEEAHLMYVAITRAKVGLDITNCTAAQAALEGNA